MPNLTLNVQNKQTHDTLISKVIQSVEYSGRKILPILKSTLIEMVKISAVIVLIDQVYRRTIGRLSEIPKNAYTAVVLAPVFEEIFFRSIIQKGIEALQTHSFKWLRGREPTDVELSIQKHFRVISTGLLFGLVHLTNTYSSTLNKVLAFSFITFGGIAYGYIREEANTTAATILCHSTYNFTLQCATVEFISPFVAVISATIMDVSLFILGIIGVNRIQAAMVFVAQRINDLAIKAKGLFSTVNKNEFQQVPV